MKVQSVLALCAVLFFAVTYSSPIENVDQTIEQSDDKNALLQEKLFRYLMAMDVAAEQATESLLADTGIAAAQQRGMVGRSTHR